MTHGSVRGAANYSLSHSDALEALRSIESSLLAKGQSAVVAIVDPHGELIGLLRIGAPTLTCIQVAINKAWTSARERQSSADVGKAARAGGHEMAYYGDPRYVGWAGGVPIWSGELVVGAIGVSGLEEDEDEALAKVGAATIARRRSEPRAERA
jgi:glc operon protein GlcG